MTSLRHHGGDRYSIRAYVGRDPLTGRPRRRSISFRTDHTPASRAFKKLVREIEDKLDVEVDGLAASGSVAELVADWLALAERDRSPSTLLAYRRHAKRITDRFGTIAAVDLRATDLDRWYTALMANGMSATNLHHVHRVVSAILTFGHNKARLSTIEAKRVTLPSSTPFEKVIPTDAEIRRIMDELPDVAWARAVRLLAMTGMRRGEVVGLTWADWQGDVITVRRSINELPGGRVHVGLTKGRRAREVFLPVDARDLLTAQRLDADDTYVFGVNGEPRRPGWVSLMWGRWARGHDLGHVTPHAFRHWYATHALEGGAPLASVARQLGHAKTSTTLDIYAAKTEEGQRAVADVIGRALSK